MKLDNKIGTINGREVFADVRGKVGGQQRAYAIYRDGKPVTDHAKIPIKAFGSSPAAAVGQLIVLLKEAFGDSFVELGRK